MLYQPTVLRREIVVDALVTVHYYEYSDIFVFPGEQHDFWELMYIDSGQAMVKVGDVEKRLVQGEMILCAPMAYHSFHTIEGVHLNLMVISFCSKSELQKISAEAIRLYGNEKEQLSRILELTQQTYSSRLDAEYYKLRRTEEAPSYNESMIQLRLEFLLLNLLLRFPSHTLGGDHVARTESDSRAQYDVMIDYIKQHIHERLTLQKISKSTLLSLSTLQRLCHKYNGCSVMECVTQIRLTRAKEMIRCRKYSFTEIASHLGYTSIHTFSRQFRKLCRMTPTEYADSVKALSERKGC